MREKEVEANITSEALVILYPYIISLVSLLAHFSEIQNHFSQGWLSTHNQITQKSSLFMKLADEVMGHFFLFAFKCIAQEKIHLIFFSSLMVMAASSWSIHMIWTLKLTNDFYVQTVVDDINDCWLLLMSLKKIFTFIIITNMPRLMHAG